jgi:hypothetical protein
MRRLLSTALLALVLCAVHPAAAAGPASLEATVTGALVDGSLLLSGPLASFGSTGHLDPESDPLAPAAPADTRIAPTSLHLTAHHLRVESEIQRQSPSSTVGQPQHDHEATTFGDAVAHTTLAREGFLFFLSPLAGHEPPLARVEAQQARLQPVASAGSEPSRRISSPARPPLEAAPGAAVLASGGLRTLHVEGDLALTLWEWDLLVSSDGTLLRSGYSYTPTAPSVAGVDTVGASEERQLFIYAEGATLDVALPPDASVALALQPRAASLDGRLVLEHPAGRLTTLDGDRALRDGDWVEGTFSATLSGLRASALHASMQGTGRAAGLDGLPVTIASPPPSLVGPIVAAVAASGVAMLGTWRLWGRRGPAPPAPQELESDSLDEETVLRWLGARLGQGTAVLWDSDLMGALDWSEERVQRALRGLRAKGLLRCKEVEFAADRSSLGQIALTSAGTDRLRQGAGSGGGAAWSARRSGLRMSPGPLA